MKLKVKLSGAEQVRAALAKEPEVVRAILKEAVLAGAQLIQAEIELKAPRRTGKLAGEGFTSKAGYVTKNSINAIVTIADQKFVYAFYNEFGVKSHHQEGRPFIRPAFEVKKAAAAAVIEQRLKDRFG